VVAPDPAGVVAGGDAPVGVAQLLDQPRGQAHSLDPITHFGSGPVPGGHVKRMRSPLHDHGI
jgi:hypothetical protein